MGTVFKIATVLMVSGVCLLANQDVNAKRIGLKNLSPQNRAVLNEQPRTGGTYSFRDSTGKPYIGQSNDIGRRLKEHVRSGRLPEKHLQSIQNMRVEGGKKMRDVVEQARIRSADIVSKGGLGNNKLAPWSRSNQDSK